MKNAPKTKHLTLMRANSFLCILLSAALFFIRSITHSFPDYIIVLSLIFIVFFAAYTMLQEGYQKSSTILTLITNIYLVLSLLIVIIGANHNINSYNFIGFWLLPFLGIPLLGVISFGFILRNLKLAK